MKKANFLLQQELEIKSLVLPIDIGPFIQKRPHWLIGHYAGSFLPDFGLSLLPLYEIIVPPTHDIDYR